MFIKKGDKQTLIGQLIRYRLNLSLPDKDAAKQFLEDLAEFLFLPGKIGSGNSVAELERYFEGLQDRLAALLTCADGEKQQQAALFFEGIPHIYEYLWLDAKAIHDGDPAAKSMEEVMATYPGFFAIYVYRIAYRLLQQGFGLLSRFFTEYAHSRTGIDIHPGARIGHSFAIDHGTGIVIGETAVIGNGVTLYQGVTLGALNVSKSQAFEKRHPTIEDGVVIYAGATILGGDTVIGAGSVIGGNVWLTSSVPSNSVVYHKSEVHVKDSHPFPEPLNFMI